MRGHSFLSVMDQPPDPLPEEVAGPPTGAEARRASLAAIIASGAIILIPTYLWSLGYIKHIDTLMYKLVWWAMGHSSQQINVSAHVAIWYLIAAVTVGAKPLSEKVSRTAFLLYIFFLQLASAHHLLVEPGLSSEWKIVNTSYMMYLAVLGSMIHGMTVPGSIEAAQRKNGFTRGVFEWLRKAPWGNPAFSGFALSLVMFGFLEGKHQPLAPLRVFYSRVVQCFLLTVAIIGFSLALGTVGYHYFGRLGWIDSLSGIARLTA